MLVGADGVNSRVRKSLEDNVPDFTVRQREVTYDTVFFALLTRLFLSLGWDCGQLRHAVSRSFIARRTRVRRGCFVGEADADVS